MSCQNSSPKSPSRKYSSRLSTPLRAGVVAVAACFISAPVLSNPLNPVVVNGTASFNQVGSLLTVTNSNGAIINWDKFSIKAGETTHFAQTSASSAVMNRVLNDPSAIYGTLSSNGRVWLINPAGILVGPGGLVDHEARVRQAETVRAVGAQVDVRAGGGDPARADHLDPRAERLDHVVDRVTGFDMAARRMDHDLDVLVRILGHEGQEVRGHALGHLHVDFAEDQDRAGLEQGLGNGRE